MFLRYHMEIHTDFSLGLEPQNLRDSFLRPRGSAQSSPYFDHGLMQEFDAGLSTGASVDLAFLLAGVNDQQPCPQAYWEEGVTTYSEEIGGPVQPVNMHFTYHGFEDRLVFLRVGIEPTYGDGVDYHIGEWREGNQGRYTKEELLFLRTFLEEFLGGEGPWPIHRQLLAYYWREQDSLRLVRDLIRWSTGTEAINVGNVWDDQTRAIQDEGYVFYFDWETKLIAGGDGGAVYQLRLFLHGRPPMWADLDKVWPDESLASLALEYNAGWVFDVVDEEEVMLRIPMQPRQPMGVNTSAFRMLLKRAKLAFDRRYGIGEEPLASFQDQFEAILFED